MSILNGYVSPAYATIGRQSRGGGARMNETVLAAPACLAFQLLLKIAYKGKIVTTFHIDCIND